MGMSCFCTHASSCGHGVGCRCPQRVDGNAGIYQRALRTGYGLLQFGNPAGGGGKAPLIRAQLRLAEPGALVQHRQQRQPQPRSRSAIGHGPGHAGRVAVGSAVRLVVQVVEFADLGVAALQHLSIELCRPPPAFARA